MIRETDSERWSGHYDKGGESFGRKLLHEQCSSALSLLRGEVDRTKLNRIKSATCAERDRNR